MAQLVELHSARLQHAAQRPLARAGEEQPRLGMEPPRHHHGGEGVEVGAEVGDEQLHRRGAYRQPPRRLLTRSRATWPHDGGEIAPRYPSGATPANPAVPRPRYLDCGAASPDNAPGSSSSRLVPRGLSMRIRLTLVAPFVLLPLLLAALPASGQVDRSVAEAAGLEPAAAAPAAAHRRQAPGGGRHVVAADPGLDRRSRHGLRSHDRQPDRRQLHPGRYDQPVDAEGGHPARRLRERAGLRPDRRRRPALLGDRRHLPRRVRSGGRRQHQHPGQHPRHHLPAERQPAGDGGLRHQPGHRRRVQRRRHSRRELHHRWS